MTTPYFFTPRALNDLEGIVRYIKLRDEAAAMRLREAIFDACEKLVGFPEMGTVRESITAMPVRFWTLPRYRNYSIVYRPETKPLKVIAIAHGKQDQKKLLGNRSQ